MIITYSPHVLSEAFKNCLNWNCYPCLNGSVYYVSCKHVVKFYNASLAYDRRTILEKKLADADVSEEDQNNLLKFLEKKETEYMRLQRHKMGVDDFELLTMIGKGAFGEVCLSLHDIQVMWHDCLCFLLPI